MRRTGSRWSSCESSSTGSPGWWLAEGGKPSDIVKLTTFVKNTDDWFPFDGEQADIYHEFFDDDYPTNTIVGARFPGENVHIEIDAIAVLD